MIIKIPIARIGTLCLSDSLKLNNIDTNSVSQCRHGKCIQFCSNKMYAFIEFSTDEVIT